MHRGDNTTDSRATRRGGLMRTAAWLCLLAILAGAGAAAAAEVKVRRMALETASGHAFSVELPLGRQKGYAWSLAAEPDPRHLELTGARFLAAGPGEKGLGREVWSFRALEPGLGELRFTLRPSYASDPRPTYVRVYQVYIWDLTPLRRPAPGHGPEGEPDQDP